MDNGTVKENILKLRQELGFTQKEMAARLNMSRVAYANLESGDTRVINPTIEKAAEIGKITVEELLLGKKNLEYGDVEAERLRGVYEGRISAMTTEYEGRLESKDRELENLRALVKSLNDNIDYQKDIISMLKKRLKEK